jgi:hypothetical protein
MPSNILGRDDAKGENASHGDDGEVFNVIITSLNQRMRVGFMLTTNLHAYVDLDW